MIQQGFMVLEEFSVAVAVLAVIHLSHIVDAPLCDNIEWNSVFNKIFSKWSSIKFLI